MSLKKLNLVLALILLTITSLVVVKLFNQAPQDEDALSLELIDPASSSLADATSAAPVFAPQYSEEQIKTRYEELKVERLIAAMRSHHTRDVMIIIADGINFDLISQDEYDKMKLVAQEENYLHIIKPILKD